MTPAATVLHEAGVSLEVCEEPVRSVVLTLATAVCRCSSGREFGGDQVSVDRGFVASAYKDLPLGSVRTEAGCTEDFLYAVLRVWPEKGAMCELWNSWKGCSETLFCTRLLAISLSLVKSSCKKAAEGWGEAAGGHLQAMALGFNTHVAVREGREYRGPRLRMLLLEDGMVIFFENDVGNVQRSRGQNQKKKLTQKQVASGFYAAKLRRVDAAEG